jgi:pimeloyl-ACP methyl ester carboxylesterase
MRSLFSLSLMAMLASAQTPEIQHRFLQVNGLKMHIAEAGTGPLVVLCHGFPELWYSYRHMLPALAKAGYHPVAPDMRGYGQTDAPPNISDYTYLLKSNEFSPAFSRSWPGAYGRQSIAR